VTYIRHVMHDGAMQWVLFDQDGDPIAYAGCCGALFEFAYQRDLVVVTVH
jgi:hypothetical protein